MLFDHKNGTFKLCIEQPDGEIRLHSIFVFHDEHDVRLDEPIAINYGQKPGSTTSLALTKHRPCASPGRRVQRLSIKAMSWNTVGVVKLVEEIVKFT